MTDGKLTHYLLWFGGMVVASGLHRLADCLGWDVVSFLKKPFQKAKPKEEK